MGRTVQFPPYGARIRVTPQEVADAWRMRSQIPAQYIIGTSDHESSFTTNEVDTEVGGFVSIGIFQLSAEECTEASLPSADLTTLEGSCDVMAWHALDRMRAIMNAAGLSTPTTDCSAFLSVAHNQGRGAAVKTVSAHGADWSAYKKRNLEAAQAALADAKASGDATAIAAAQHKLQWWLDVFAYGDDCISGGARWAEVALH